MTRSVLGLLAVLWLNMAVLPCAMAFEADDHDCPHCPPSAASEMAAHHGHAKADTRSHCATMQSQCGDPGEASVDARGGKLKITDVSDLTFVTSPKRASLPAAVFARTRSATDPPELTGRFPPLHVLYCVYLD